MKYSQDTKDDAIRALADGMTRAEVSGATGIPQGTLAHWQNPKGRSKPAIPAPSTVRQDSLEQFICSLEALVADYKRLKSERAMFQSQVEKWKTLAGRLNEDISSAASR